MADRDKMQGDDSSSSSGKSQSDGQSRSGSDRSSSNIGSRPSKASRFGAAGSDSESPETSKSAGQRKDRKLSEEADVGDYSLEDLDDLGYSAP